MSDAALPQGRKGARHHIQRKYRAVRNVGARRASDPIRRRDYAEHRRLYLLVAATAALLFPGNTSSNFAGISMGRSPISSKKIVLHPAAWKSPAFDFVAPVKRTSFVSEELASP